MEMVNLQALISEHPDFGGDGKSHPITGFCMTPHKPMFCLYWLVRHVAKGPQLTSEITGMTQSGYPIVKDNDI